MKQALVLLGYVLGQACRHLKVRTKIRTYLKIGYVLIGDVINLPPGQFHLIRKG